MKNIITIIFLFLVTTVVWGQSCSTFQGTDPGYVLTAGQLALSGTRSFTGAVGERYKLNLIAGQTYVINGCTGFDGTFSTDLEFSIFNYATASLYQDDNDDCGSDNDETYTFVAPYTGLYWLLLSENDCDIACSFGCTGTVSVTCTTCPSSAPAVPAIGQNNPVATDLCADAPLVQNLEGYGGSTSSAYTATGNAPSLVSNFCGSIENNSFIKFIASATTAEFEFWIPSCSVGVDGVQFQVFSVTGACATGTWTSVSNGCVNPTGGANSWGKFVATGLTAGNTYYLMFDGFAGNVCDYVIKGISGLATCPLDPGTVSQVCNTAGTSYTVQIPFTGGGTKSYTITGGTNTGDNPSSVASGTMIIGPFSNNTGYTISITTVDGICDYDFSVPTYSCPDYCAAINPVDNGTTTCGTPFNLSYVQQPVYEAVQTSCGMVNVSSPTAVNLTDDDSELDLPIGFTFNFFGTNYTTFNLHSNGIISFDAPGSNVNGNYLAYDPVTIPNGAAVPNNYIAGLYTDLNPTCGGTVTYKTIGTAPNRQLVVTWTNIEPYETSCGAPDTEEVTFQIVLTEGTNAINTIVSTLPSSFSTSWSPTNSNATQGVEAGDGAVAFTTPGRNWQVWTGIAPTDLDCTTFQPVPLTVVFNGWYTGGAGGTLVGTANPQAVTPSATTTYTGSWTVNGRTCTKDVVVTISGGPTMTLGTATNVTACGGTDGTIPLTFTNVPNGTYTLSYQKDGTPATASIAVASNAATLTGLGAGSYTNFSISVSGCTATAAGPRTITAPSAPTTTGATICAGGSGTLSSSTSCPSASTTGSLVVCSSIGGTFGASPGLTYNLNFSAIPAGATVTGVSYGASNGSSTDWASECDFNLSSPTITDGVDLDAGDCCGAPSSSGNFAFPAGSSSAFNGAPASGTWIIEWHDDGSPYTTNTLAANSNYCVTVTYAVTTPGTLQWYTAATGGTPVQTGSPFNPVGDAEVIAAGAPYSSLTNTNTPGTYTFYAACSSAPNCRTATDFVISTAPNAGTLSGSQNVCGTGTTTFASDGDTGGTWSSSNTAVATVNATTGVVTGVAAGTATITYSVAATSPCTTATATRTVTVVAPPTANAGSLVSTACSTAVALGATGTGTWSGGAGTFSDTSSPTSTYTPTAGEGGTTVTLTWTVAATAPCTVAATDQVDVVVASCGCAAPPSVAITQATASTCGTAAVTLNYTVANGPAAVTTTGTGTLSTTSLANGTSTFTYTPAAGETSVTVTATIADPDGAGPCIASFDDVVITVVAPPNAGTLSGLQNVCGTGTTTFASNGNTGGTWSSSNTAVATVNATTGVVTGVAAGTATITYSVAATSPCTTPATATRTVTVVAPPTANAGSDVSTACSTAIALGATGTGTWSGGAGTFSNANSPTSTYTPTAGEGGTTVTLTWTVAATTPCTVAATDQVDVVVASCGCAAPPSVAITQATASTCGTAAVTLNYTVANGPAAVTTTGTGTLSSTSLANGTSTFTYTPAAGETSVTVTATIADPDGAGPCTSSSDNVTITVVAPPNAGTLSGAQNVCGTGTTTFASDGNTGGTWSSSNTAVATVDASTGVVTGVAAGTATITYSVAATSPCTTPATATRTVTVVAPPNAGTLSGAQNVCGTGTTTFTSDGNTGGTWSSSNTAVATINASTGVVTGVAAGTATITYSVAATSPCTTAATATRTVTVVAPPNAGTLSGAQNVCGTGTTTFTSDGDTGGTWSSSNTAVATVNASTGVVTGVAAGTATITYSVAATSPCTTPATATRTVTVVAPPTANAGSDVPTACSTAIALGATGTGTWSGGAGTFSNANSPTSTYTPTAGEGGTTVTLTWTVAATTPCTVAATDQVDVVVASCGCAAPPSVAITQATASTCGTAAVTLNYTVANGPAAVTTTGTGTLSSTSLANGTSTFTYTPAAGETSVTVTATIADPDGAGPCTASTDNVSVTVTANPTPSITSSGANLCSPGSRTLVATPAGGTFSVLSGPGSISGTTLTASGIGAIVVQYSVTVGGCTGTTTQTITTVACTRTITITDPCSCNNDASVSVNGTPALPVTNGTFDEVIGLNGLVTGDVITVNSVTGLQSAPGTPYTNATAAAAFVVAIPTATLSGVHTDNVGYTISVHISNTVPGSEFEDDLVISNKCAYPNPDFSIGSFVDCNTAMALTTVHSAEGNGTAAYSGTGVSGTNFTPTGLTGAQTITLTYTGINDGNGGISTDSGTTPAFPGCQEVIQKPVTVNCPACQASPNMQWGN
jgi:uncharacterized protein YjdB